jgi:hypothetical protein
VPTSASVPDVLRSTPFLASAAVRAGLLTHRRLHGATWRRLFHDVYVHRDVPVTHALRSEAVTLLLPAAVVSGSSAAVLWGVDLVGVDDDVEVTLPPRSHMVRLPGVTARRAVLHRGDACRRKGVPVTTPEATAVRLAAVLDHDRAVAAVDQLIATGVVDLGAIRARAALMSGPGSARARAVAESADGLAESPQETRVRLLLQRSGLPCPVPQYRIEHGGRFVARVDFGWPEHKVAVEYDGAWHGEQGQFIRDRRRLNRLRAAGWTVVFVTADDLRRPGRLIAEIAAALGIAVSARG